MDVGRRIGKYVLDERIAVGGMAEVWAAHVEGLEGFVKPVALKFILESFSGDPELERLFVNEARIAARLQHANLVAVFDFDKVDAGQERGLAGRYYIAMERVEGHDLRRIAEVARHAGYVFPIGLVLYVAGEVLKALRYVHERRDASGPLGLVHRDVSPHNVLVGIAGEVKLSDFGIAKAREHSGRTTKPGSLRGKISYASPEQLSGQPVDHRTDQFAAGVTIWELLAGRRLFDGATDLEILAKVARCEIPALAETPARRDVPPAVESVLCRMLAAEPDARFPTTAAALSAVLSLPSYTPDGAPLGELVRTLFRSAMPDLSHTLPLQASPAGARAADVETRTMHGASPAAADADPAAAGAGRGKTPTRRAKRTSDALARSPAAGGAVVDGAGGTTADVRSARRAVKLVVGALALGLAVAAAALVRRPRDAAPEPPTSATAAPANAAKSTQPPPAAAAPVAGAPNPPAPVAGAPIPSAPVAGAPILPAPVAGAPPKPVAPEPVASPSPVTASAPVDSARRQRTPRERAAREAVGASHHSVHRRRPAAVPAVPEAAEVADAPVVAPVPTPAPTRAAEPTRAEPVHAEPVVKRSANGAPIIE